MKIHFVMFSMLLISCTAPSLPDCGGGCGSDYILDRVVVEPEIGCLTITFIKAEHNRCSLPEMEISNGCDQDLVFEPYSEGNPHFLDIVPAGKTEKSNIINVFGNDKFSLHADLGTTPVRIDLYRVKAQRGSAATQ